ncbi:hypothetical protein [Halarchaeum salinum]|uniref:Glycosyltransferase n=1 Tax=Halarchaeum salinum TaxID=489912 RepID=A0AAV3S6Z9_9EURY
MKVTFVTPPQDEGGIGKYADGICREMRDDAQVSRLDLPEGLGLIKHVALAWHAGTTDADVVHVQFEYAFFNPKLVFAWVFFPLLAVLTRLHGTSTAVTMHEVWESDTVDGGLEWRYVWITHTLIAVTTDSLVFLSQNASEAFDVPVPVKRATLPHGVDLGETRSVDEGSAKELFGFSPDDSIIAQIGYVSPRKGTELFLKLAEKYPEHQFLIAGGPRREEDQEYFEGVRQNAPGNVTVTGVLSDRRFHAAFVATDVAVLSYTDIRQSGILNWCFAYCVPTICRRIPYFERIAAEWGGILLFDDMSGAVERLSIALRESERLSAQMEEYRESHSFERIAERHLELYLEL